ncbi:putative enterotoxin [Ophiocordyceps unilateralis]|uniref:Enterotoxin n=1 Tax=Ophiocordyceps unilateralis TaxID=268505 RepID=A0A2A9P9D3_OPHUN|nr:putative enterotoxin [Ophiocordyceps unilateralis]
MLSRLSLLLPWLLLAGSWLPLTHSRSSTLGPSNDHVHIVYRVDQRSPRQIRYAGGFSPRGVDGNGFLRPPPDTSLFNHVRGEGWMSRNNSGYVSTTSSLGVALHILRESGTVPGYIYHIHVTPNFINVARTLGDYYEHQGELEFAALGGILWTQVLAWQRIEEAAGTPNGYHVSERVLNPDYHSQLFDWASDGGAQFQLAGFPDDHVVLRQRLDPWCRDGRQKKRAVMRKRAPIRCPMAQESPKALATKYMASIMQVGKLYVYARVSPNSWAGTTDSVFVMVGNSKPTLLFKNPYPGKAQPHEHQSPGPAFVASHSVG